MIYRRKLPWAAAVSLALLVFVTAAPARAVVRQAFVTSTWGTGDLSTWAETDSDGLAGADEICQVRAAAAGLANSGLYRAWLSTAATDAYCHLFGLAGSRASACGGVGPVASTLGPWVRRDGTPFAGHLGLMTGPEHAVYQPLLFDETGAAIQDVEFWYWTGTDPDGVEFGGTCSDWSSGSSGEFGGTGIAWMVGGGWTYDVSLDCDTMPHVRLLCLEAGLGEAQKLPSESGALAFVSSARGTGDLSSWPDALTMSGIDAGDEICQARAAAAKLPNPESFVAWLSDSVTDARDRVTVDGPFVRVDGFLLAPSKLELLGSTPDLRTGLNVDEFGAYYIEPISASYVWTGSDQSGGAGLSHCDGWTSAANSDQGNVGNSATTRFTWQVNGSAFCDSSRPIYCFSNVAMLFWDNFERGNTSRWSNGTP